MEEKLQFTQLDYPLNASVNIEGEEFLYFGGTAYLGMPQNAAFISLYFEGIKRYGLNNGTSRSNNVQLGIYDQAEKYAALKYGAESALITSSGYLAAQLTVKALHSFGEIVYTPGAHPALWHHEEPKSKISFNDWEDQFITKVNSSENDSWVLVTNSMNNLYPEIYDFSFLNRIADTKKVLLIIDDSHGIGINNGGLSALTALDFHENITPVLVASMAKALGVDAGLVLAPEPIIKRLKKTNEFLGASPPSAAGLYAFMNAKLLYSQAFDQLQQNIIYLSSALRNNSDWHFIPKFPVFFCKNTDLSAQLIKHKMLCSSFPYPNQDGPLLNRIVLSSWHDEKQLDKLITTLSQI